MKRPEGFDPPKKDAPAASARTPAPKQPRPPRARPQARKSEAQKPRVLKPGVGQPGRSAAKPTKAPSVKDAGAQEARAQLKQAARDRRRYERTEVKRFTRRSRTRRRTLLASLAIVIVLVGLVAVAVYSPILALKTIRIEGATRVSAADVRAAVDDQVGTPLALVNFNEITAKLAQFPLIRSYVTETVPPNTLIVHIVERSPIASISTSAGFTVVDPAGVVISTSATRPDALPLIDVGATTTKGGAFKAAVQVLLALPPDVLAKVDRVTAQTRDDVTLVLSGVGQRVVWGSADKSEVKARVLAGLMKTQKATAVVEYDVSAPSSGVIRPG